MEEFKRLRYPVALAVVTVFVIGVALMNSLKNEGAKNDLNTSESTMSDPEEPDLIKTISKNLRLSEKQDDEAQKVSDTVVDLTKNAIIQGEFMPLGGWNPSDYQVCAKNLSSEERLCTNGVKISNELASYKLGVPEGKYLIYALHPTSDFVGIYNEQVSCGENDTCSHSPIELTVVVGKSYSDINPDDWTAMSKTP